jgi:hypothetical protein
MTYKGLPLIYMDILDDMNGIEIISLVDRPAVEKEFIAFNEEKVQFAVNDEKRVVTGVALIPGQKIYRRTEDGKEFYMTFTKEAVERIAVKFFADHNTTNVNLQHEFNVNGCVYFESYLTNKERGIYPTEFGELPDSTWIVSCKILNDDVWKLVKEGVLRGFSIEGVLNVVDEEKPVLNSIDDLVNYINNK